MTAIRRGWFHLASGAGFGRVFGFTCNLLLSRWLGPTELGLFSLVTTTVQTSETLVRCGGDYALNFELGGHPESSQTGNGAKLVQALTQICSISTLLICFGAAIWVWWGQALLPVGLLPIHRLVMSLLLILMIACEGSSASAWETLLVTHRTAQLALRQGLFLPLRLLFAGFGALVSGVLGAMLGWSIVAVFQCLWLKSVLGNLWKPLQIWPLLHDSMRALLKRGLPFYTANMLSSIVFYPLLLEVVAGSDLAQVGYLRVGQILQQLFAFLPATLVPVLFLRLRSKTTFADQVSLTEIPLRIIWLVLLQILFLYCMLDQSLIVWVFGVDFIPALLPTRFLLITALFECLTQLMVQPILAAGQTRVYGIWQNGAAIIAAVLGWLCIPYGGLSAYLVVRLIYVLLPLVAFGFPLFHQLREPGKMLPLALASISYLVFLWLQVSSNSLSILITPFLSFGGFLVLIIFQRQDLFLVKQMLCDNS